MQSFSFYERTPHEGMNVSPHAWPEVNHTWRVRRGELPLVMAEDRVAPFLGNQNTLRNQDDRVEMG